MTSLFQTYASTPAAENNTLFALLFLINGLVDCAVTDVDTSINNIEDATLIFAVHMVELLNGIEVPESLLADKKKSLRKLADDIKVLPRLSDEVYEKKLMTSKFWWRAVIDGN